MPKRLKKPVRKLKTPPKPKRPSDPNRAAHAMMAEHMGRVQGEAADQMILDPRSVISEHMAKIGAKGGRASGAKRMQMSKRQRVEIATKAAAARWGKRRTKG